MEYSRASSGGKMKLLNFICFIFQMGFEFLAILVPDGRSNCHESFLSQWTTCRGRTMLTLTLVDERHRTIGYGKLNSFGIIRHFQRLTAINSVNNCLKNLSDNRVVSICILYSYLSDIV